MNVYLLSRTDIVGYDQFDAFVIAANTEEEALALKRPAPKRYLEDTWRDWTTDDKIEVELVGTTDKYTGPTEILGSFNAS